MATTLDYLVADQNAIGDRKQDLPRHLAEAENGGPVIVLPDAAFLEMYKGAWVKGQRVRGPEWKITVGNALAEMSLHHKGIRVARPVADLIRSELEPGALTLEIFSVEHTARLRLLVQEWQRQGNTILDGEHDRVLQAQDAAEAGRLDHGANKAIVLRLAEGFREHATELVRHLRSSEKGAMDKEAREFARAELRRDALRDESVIETFARSFAEMPLPQERVPQLLRAPTFTRAFALCTLDLAFMYIQDPALGGPDRRAEKFTNDILDTDYVVTASRGGGLITADNRTRQLYDDVMDVFNFAKVTPSDDPGKA